MCDLVLFSCENENFPLFDLEGETVGARGTDKFHLIPLLFHSNITLFLVQNLAKHLHLSHLACLEFSLVLRMCTFFIQPFVIYLSGAHITTEKD